MNEAIYLYGFVPRATELPPGGLLGIDGGPVELRRTGAVDAVITRVAADRYGPAAIEPQLKDLRWVAEQGVRHEQVVAWFLDHAEILPVRLLTLYSSDAELAREASAHSERVVRELERLSGFREWDLKVAYHASRLEARIGELSEEVARLDDEIAQAAPGKRFLLGKKRADAVQREVSRTARRLAEELLHELGAEAAEIIQPRLADRAPSAELPVVLNAALLVPTIGDAGLRERVQRRAEELNERGIVVEFSGPWAPYRFLETDDGGDLPGAVAAGGADAGRAGESRARPRRGGDR